VRGFVAGRAGSIPEAQSTTRTLEVGMGLGFELLPEASRWLLGVRTDAMVSYFQAAHLSEDDPAPDRQSRFLPGADLLVEAGFRLTGALSLYAGAGVAAMFGTTSIYTHGEQVAVVPAFRMVGELGLRTGF
jgi:opacity protein-like surface antigen